jgi:hypothetical protein
MPIFHRDRWGRALVVPPDGGKPIGYTRVTTVAKALDDGGGLIPWKATLAMTGLMRRPGLRGRFEALMTANPDLGPWYGSIDSKNESKKLVEECAEAGGSGDRADLGTALHSMFEQYDRGESVIPPQASTAADLDAYIDTTRGAGITFDPDYIETMVVLDEWQVSGSPDRLVTYVPGFDLPLVSDLKTGADLQYSWQSICTQLATYAHANNVYIQGEASNGLQDQRLPMPAVDQDYALVIHSPAGEARCDLWIIDIAAGWEAFELSMKTRLWRSRKGLAKAYTIVPAVSSALQPAAPPAQPADAFDGLVDGYVDEPADPVRREWVIDRLRALAEFDGALDQIAIRWPDGLATFKASDRHTNADLNRIIAVIQVVEGLVGATWETPDPTKPVKENTRWTTTSSGASPTSSNEPTNTSNSPSDPTVSPASPSTSSEPVAPSPTFSLNSAPDEGPPVQPPAIDKLQAAYSDLSDTARAWINTIARDAQTAGRPLHLAGNPGQRRYRIVHGLVALAAAGYDDDEILRGLTGYLMKTDPTVFAAIPVGGVLSALDAIDATVFADLCQQFIVQKLVANIDDDGHLVFTK